jgi:hypothetical protein
MLATSSTITPPASLRSERARLQLGIVSGFISESLPDFIGIPDLGTYVGFLGILMGEAKTELAAASYLFVFHLHGTLYLYSEVLMLAIRLPQSIEKRLEKLARWVTVLGTLVIGIISIGN